MPIGITHWFYPCRVVGHERGLPAGEGGARAGHTHWYYPLVIPVVYACRRLTRPGLQVGPVPNLPVASQALFEVDRITTRTKSLAYIDESEEGGDPWGGGARGV